MKTCLAVGAFCQEFSRRVRVEGGVKGDEKEGKAGRKWPEERGSRGREPRVQWLMKNKWPLLNIRPLDILAGMCWSKSDETAEFEGLTSGHQLKQWIRTSH